MPYLRPEVMLIKKHRSTKPHQIMDPDCAICSQPALVRCDCEAKGLDIAVRQAEHKMMKNIFDDIRAWVRGHAQDYILSYFGMLTHRRKEMHAQALARLSQHAAYYRAHPHPSEIAAIDAELKRGIDDDWKQSVQRYPEVLDYFYGLVDLNIPSDGDRVVSDPPLSALAGVGMGGLDKGGRERRVRVRESSEVEERRRRRRSLVRDRDDALLLGGRRERLRVMDPIARVDSVPPQPPMPTVAAFERERERERRRYATPVPSMTGGYSYVTPGYIG